MKNIKKFVVTFVVGVFLGNVLIAAPASLPIGNKAQLRAYALSQVAGGSLSVYGSTVLPNSAATTYKNVGMSAGTVLSINTIMDRLQATFFSFYVNDVEKNLFAWGTLMNKDWQPLFYGNADVQIVGALHSLYSPGGVQMKLASWLPLDMGESVSSAYVIGKDGSYQNISSYGSTIYFPSDYCGGQLYVTLSTATGYYTVAYNAGSLMPTVNVAGKISVWMDGYDEYVDKVIPGTIPVALFGYTYDGAEAPVANIQLSTSRQISFSAVILNADGTAVVEYPVTGWLLNTATGVETQITLKSGQQTSPQTFPAGNYLFYPDTKAYEVTPAQNGGSTTSTKG